MTTAALPDAAYVENAEGIFAPLDAIRHRDDAYDPACFALLEQMQANHFWYHGRHRFLLHAFKAQARLRPRGPVCAVDLGGGCGGWVNYLRRRCPGHFAELALADSSEHALRRAADVVGPEVQRYQVDLLDLRWRRRWDVAFLLDVLEHIPQDVEALRQVRESLAPGGLLFVTTPALRCFWTYNDELVHHVRRYSRRDFRRLARMSGLELCQARYFMFFLSPLVVLSRLKRPDLAAMTPAQRGDLFRHTHRVPAAPLNRLLHLVFACETPLGNWLPFPWGTSILGVFRRP